MTRAMKGSTLMHSADAQTIPLGALSFWRLCFSRRAMRARPQPREMKHLSEGIMEAAEGLAPGDAK